jgi:hypothetical protein
MTAVDFAAVPATPTQNPMPMEREAAISFFAERENQPQSSKENLRRRANREDKRNGVVTQHSSENISGKMGYS